MIPKRPDKSVLSSFVLFGHRRALANTHDSCAPQKVYPVLIARFRPDMVGCFWPVSFLRSTGARACRGARRVQKHKRTQDRVACSIRRLDLSDHGTFGPANAILQIASKSRMARNEFFSLPKCAISPWRMP